jgi:cell division protein FtsB
VLLLATCALVAKALLGESGLLATRMASSQESHLAERIAALKTENDALREQARRLREDPAFIEEVARRELGLVRPGERVFTIIDPVSEETEAIPPAVER